MSAIDEERVRLAAKNGKPNDLARSMYNRDDEAPTYTRSMSGKSDPITMMIDKMLGLDSVEQAHIARGMEYNKAPVNNVPVKTAPVTNGGNNNVQNKQREAVTIPTQRPANNGTTSTKNTSPSGTIRTTSNGDTTGNPTPKTGTPSPSNKESDVNEQSIDGAKSTGATNTIPLASPVIEVTDQTDYDNYKINKDIKDTNPVGDAGMLNYPMIQGIINEGIKAITGSKTATDTMVDEQAAYGNEPSLVDKLKIPMMSETSKYNQPQEPQPQIEPIQPQLNANTNKGNIKNIIDNIVGSTMQDGAPDMINRQGGQPAEFNVIPPTEQTSERIIGKDITPIDTGVNEQVKTDNPVQDVFTSGIINNIQQRTQQPQPTVIERVVTMLKQANNNPELIMRGLEQLRIPPDAYRDVMSIALSQLNGVQQ